MSQPQQQPQWGAIRPRIQGRFQECEICQDNQADRYQVPTRYGDRNVCEQCKDTYQTDKE